MYTEPEIVSSRNLHTRAYVKVYIDGTRYRFYNGKALDINCTPNLTKTLRERDRALRSLCFTLRKKLETGWMPNVRMQVTTPTVALTTEESINQVRKEIAAQDLSALYKRDVEKVADEFTTYMQGNNLLTTPVSDFTTPIVEDFLKQFNHSATYYMNKRRTLSGIFCRLVKSKMLTQNPVSSTTRMKEKATLHQAFTKDQLRDVLHVLEDSHSNLYLCALLMYGCFLRPHREIRNLRRRDLNSELSSISLDGDENKSGRVRTVFVPQYVRDAIMLFELHELDADANLFTGNCDTYNESYFNTAWSRVKKKLQQKKLVGDNHTLYSFRHTAAVNLYVKTKDLYKVQQAMGHSSMTVTLTYMRSLGLINNLNADDAPDL